MAAIPYHVAEAFKAGKYARAGNFYSTGHDLYSYEMKIAHWGLGELKWDINLDNPPKISVTTSRHIKAALSVLR